MPRCLLLLALLAVDAAAQPTVRGRVRDDVGAPLPGATVVLLAEDALVKGAITDADGRFLLEAPAGTYTLRVSLVGFEPVERDRLALDGDLDLGAISLAAGVALDGVTVEAQRALFVQEPDRIVVNVAERAAFAGTSALDVLARSPGVDVDPQGGLSILGKEGVTVLIDGRQSYLPPDAVAAYLAGLGADAIERIEILTTPPANLDAEGAGGFVNIVLRADPGDGLTGSVAASAGYGGGEVGSLTANATLRRGPWTAYGTYGYLRDGQTQETTLTKRIAIGDAGTAPTFATTGLVSDRDPTRNNHTLRVGADLRLGATTLGALLSAYTQRWTMEAASAVRLGRTAAATGFAADTLLGIGLTERNQWDHVGGTLAAEHRVAGGPTLAVSGSLLRYENANPVGYALDYATGDGAPLFADAFASDKATVLDIAVVEADASLAVSDALTLAVGGKVAASRFTNDVAVARPALATLLPDGDLDDASDLEETIYAAYAQADATPSARTTLRAGLRYEHDDTYLTDAAAAGPGAAVLVDRQRGRFFPSLSVTQQLGEADRLTLAYTRRLTRPTFRDIAPFVIFLDPSTFFAGNAGLRASTAHTVRAAYQRGSLGLTLDYTIEDDAIARFQNAVVPGTATQVIASENLDGVQTVAASLSAPFAPAAWWMTESSATLLHERIDAGGATTTQTGVRLTTNQQVTLRRGTTLTANAFYQSPTRVGTVRFDAFGGLTVGVQQALGPARATLALSDTFDTVVRTGTTDAPGVFIARTFDFSQPTVRLSVSLPFGRGEVERARPTEGASEERERAN